MQQKLPTIDISSLGIKVGLEFHQQVKAPYPGAVAIDPKFDPQKHGSKLFCRCPAVMRDDPPDLQFIRELRAVSGETGQIDVAARFEHAKGAFTVYKAHSTTTCLIEYDEEPIMPVNPKAMEIALFIAKRVFNMTLIDEIHVCRKIIVDGSNVSGFQRTMLVALGTPDSYIEVNGQKIHIEALSLEEDSAKNLGEEKGMRVFQLDRLGIPLIEVATAPDITSPEMTRQVAARIGALLRTTGFMKRGLGTIRQDLNISIAKGARVEVKGVQDLSILEDLVRNEAIRQYRLLELIEEMKARNLSPASFSDLPIVDLTSHFTNTSAKFIRSAIKSRKKVLGTRLPNFKGLLGVELQPNYRFGTELSDRIKAGAKVGGLLHSDELPAYGISSEEVKAVQTTLQCTENDGFILVVDSEKKATRAFEIIFSFLSSLFSGLEGEVRHVKKGNVSGFLRPLPGGSRMYPETDAIPFKLTSELLQRISRIPLEFPEERKERYMSQLGLSTNLAEGMSLHPELQFFEELVRTYPKVSPTTIAATLLETTVTLRRQGTPIDQLTDAHFHDLFKTLEEGKFDSKAIPQILDFLARHPTETVSAALSSLGLEALSTDEVKEIVYSIAAQHRDLILQRKHGATGVLMGKIMKEVRGRASGKLVASLVKQAIEDTLK